MMLTHLMMLIISDLIYHQSKHMLFDEIGIPPLYLNFCFTFNIYLSKLLIVFYVDCVIY
jgi:hypothetical protein